MQITAKRPYRAYYSPLDQYRTPIVSESGVLPFVQLQAANAESAQRAAHAVTGCPIERVERIEPVGVAA